jgi:hypothetical protein
MLGLGFSSLALQRPVIALPLRHDRPQLETFCEEINGGASIAAHPRLPFNTGKFERISARFQALNIGHAAINS